MNTNLKGEINYIYKPILIMLLSVVVLIIGLSIGFNQISGLRTKIESSKKTVATLQQKVNALETVGEILSGDITFLDIVLPARGAVLYGLSQVKDQAIMQNIAISNIKTGTSVEVGDGVSKIAIGFEAEGDSASMYNFLESFSKMLPLINVDKVSMTHSENVTRASISVNVYSAEYPKKIPSVTESIKDLSKEEIALLRKISTYTLPNFVEPSMTDKAQAKENPFAE